MESKYIQGIERKIKEIAREYKNKGYEVIIEPRSSLTVPNFIKNFQPDLIALSETDNVVIEVKSSESKTDFKSLEELANIVNSKENWRFELVFTNPRNKFSIDNQLTLIDLNKIQQRIQVCNDLLVQNNVEPAFLLAWSTLEAGIRYKLNLLELNDDLSKRPPLHLMKSLYSFGIIGQSQLRKLEMLNQLRNQLIHGFNATLNRENVYELIETIEILTGSGENSEIYDWLSALDLEGYEEIYCLYRAIAETDEYGLFKVYESNGKTFVKSDVMDEELELKDQDQIKEILEIIEDEYMDGMDPEGFYGFHRAMEKDD
ncbi:MAG: hypothetical protein AB7O47_07255 [Flavobacteriales bacterium]